MFLRAFGVLVNEKADLVSGDVIQPDDVSGDIPGVVECH